MRITLAFATPLAFAALIACGPGGDDAGTGTGTGDATTDSTLVATGETGFVGPALINPVAVGFELDAVVLANGTLSGYRASDGAGGLVDVAPSIVLTFATAAFFDADTPEAQDAESCIAFGLFDVAPMTSSQIPINSSATLWNSYEGVLSIEFTTCQDIVDPEVWGVSAAELLGPFEGAHIGYGFGPLTTYLEDQWSADNLTLYDGQLFANYIAINDANGTWIGEDWTSAILFDWDENTGELKSEPDPNDPNVQLLIPMDISATPPGNPIPQGYVRSFAYWYQDFPLMDFSNLTDGA